MALFAGGRQLFSEIIQAIRATLYERATSPLSGSLVISWLVWNYKIVLAMFSSLPVRSKILFIENIYPSEIAWLYLVVGPVVTALLYIIAFPFPAKWAYKYSRERQRELNAIRQQVDDEKLLSKEQSIELIRGHAKMKESFEEEIGRMNNELQLTQEAVEKAEAAAEMWEEKSTALQTERDELLSRRHRSETSDIAADYDENAIRGVLERNKFRLIYNPQNGKSKGITFSPDGKVAAGSNENEHGWRTKNGRLELLNIGGEVHSRFKYFPEYRIFLAVDSEELPNTHGQSISIA